MADVFISYKSQDRMFTQQMAPLLRLHELSVWWDDELRGDRADSEIIQQIAASKAVVVLLSARSVAADWVQGEMIRAGDKVVPVRIEYLDHRQVPTPLMNRDIIDLASWQADPSHSEFLKLVARCIELKTGTRPPSVAAAVGPRQASGSDSAHSASIVTRNEVHTFTGTATFGPNSTINVRDSKK